MRDLDVVWHGVTALTPYARNSRTHSDEQVAQVAASIKEFGWTNPILIDEGKSIIAGHGRLQAAQRLGEDKVPTITLTGLTDAQKRAYVIADNKLALNAGWDEEMLKIEVNDLLGEGFDIDLIGFDPAEIDALLDHNDENEVTDTAVKGSLSDRFGVPPFSVMSAREGWWQNRKRGWLALGIKSELGRGDNAAPSGSARPATDYSKSKARGDGHGRAMPESMLGKTYGGQDRLNALMGGKPDDMNATSIFDPVLCELGYSWFSPKTGVILDPFAGGSVRGVVASKLGRQYVGIELRAEQVKANRQQGDDICDDPMPVWHTGDSRNIGKLAEGIQADLIYSCPPYADLEVYSDNPADLSTLGYNEFKQAYFDIINESCKLLKDNRFACFVVGEVRDKAGNYYNFVGDTIEAFRQAGLHYYNEAILVTAVGSLPVRAGRQFAASRKLGKTHQNVLVFVKGDGKKAANECGLVEVNVPDADEDAD